MRKRIKKQRIKLWNEFKKFITRGNVMDLAVGVIIGAAFSKIVSSLVNDIIMPLAGLLMGKIDFKSLKWILKLDEEGNVLSSVNYGMFIQYVVDFLIMAACVFLLVKFFAAIKKKAEEIIEKEKKEQEAAAPPAPAAPPVPTKEELLLTEIRDLLRDKK
ncbi:MAG TPA: large-conductance mechanosensitive channel protein MscL [Clostridia bacterium]|nr:large-conductance mechanosensitive channel protein MscL [Clostridia bacterium]